ncbi:MAG: hypothetical protein ABL949_06440 [Fimbriimonadaceae bacterium]
MRKRRGIVLVCVLLGSVGYLALSVNPSPPLPSFLAPFGKVTTLIAAGHATTVYKTAKPSCTLQFEELYFVDASPEQMVLAFADSIGARNVFVHQNEAHTFEREVAIEAIFWKGKRMTMVSTLRKLPISGVDYWCAARIPKWLDLRFGKNIRSDILNPANAKDFDSDMINVDALRPVRANILLSTGK